MNIPWSSLNIWTFTVFKRIEKKIEKLIQAELERRTMPHGGPVLPHGYNPLERIRGGLFHWVQVPFNGTPVWCELRCMNASQLASCGNFSSINSNTAAEKTSSFENVIKILNYHEQIVRKSLNKPSFDEIEELAGTNDRIIPKIKQDLEELKKIDLKALPLRERLEVQQTVQAACLFACYILPEDTVDFIVSWAMGHDVSDIKKISSEQFLEAAVLAVNGNDNPADHIPGVFTDNNKEDMNKYAWTKYAEYLELKRIEAHAGRAVTIGGPKKA